DRIGERGEYPAFVVFGGTYHHFEFRKIFSREIDRPGRFLHLRRRFVAARFQKFFELARAYRGVGTRARHGPYSAGKKNEDESELADHSDAHVEFEKRLRRENAPSLAGEGEGKI